MGCDQLRGVRTWSTRLARSDQWRNANKHKGARNVVGSWMVRRTLLRSGIREITIFQGYAHRPDLAAVPTANRHTRFHHRDRAELAEELKRLVLTN
jgi:hypothetical protein